MIDYLTIAASSTTTTRNALQQALHDATGTQALLIMPMLETTARLLQDLDALQSAVKSDKAEK